MKSKPAEPVDHIGSMPVFVITGQRPSRDNLDHLTVSFRCPCGRIHEHAWRKSDNPTRPQHRAAHCTAGPLCRDGYFIVLRSSAVEPERREAIGPTEDTPSGAVVAQRANGEGPHSLRPAPAALNRSGTPVPATQPFSDARGCAGSGGR